MARIARRDHGAYTTLVERHLDRLHGYLTQLCGSRAQADDLAQETLMQVWENAARFDPAKASARTWLYRIGHHRFIDEQRRRRPTTTISEQSDIQENAEPTRDPARELPAALRSLPESQRTALALRTMSGFSTQQTALVMGLGERAVESLLARGRRALRERFAAKALNDVTTPTTISQGAQDAE